MNELATTETSNISIKLNSASQALAEVTTDFERIEIRDTAKAIQAASEILKMKSIQVEASFLVMDAERDVTKANPPESSVESGSRGGKKEGVVQGDTLIKPTTLRDMRQAHDNLSDTEYSEIKSKAADNEEPLKRKV